MAGTPLAVPALHDLCLRVAAGEVVAVMGETGAGKTTLLQFCNGLLRPGRPGIVRVLGIDTGAPGASLRLLRLRACLLLQRAQAQLIERFVGDDVAFGPRQLGLPPDEVRERVRLALEAVGLSFERFRDRRTLNLSGGEAKRVALAGLLAMQPELLLLDEPTAGLDPEARQSLLRLIAGLSGRGTTVLLTSTNMEDLPGVADRLVVMGRGRIVGEVAVSEIWRHGRLLRDSALDLPETGLVVEAMRRHRPDLEPRSLEPEPLAEDICRISPTSDT
jgi:energy-coupling factor transport system ATP-binding protein